MNTTILSQTWVDTNLYPFENKFLELEQGNMHFVDEGQGEVILFVHGTPTWSFLYRDFIQELSKTNRCIAIDHLGFGLSEKPDSVKLTPQVHAQNLSEFIQKLDLQNITLVVHDFGGPIGLAAGIENTERIKRVVLFNTWLWETHSNPGAQKIDKIANSWLGRFLYLNMNFSPKVLLKKGFADKSNLSKTVHQHYIKPFPNKKSRHALLDLAQSLAGSSDWYQQQWRQLDKLANKDWLMIWGTKDEFITTDYLTNWTKRLPNARLVEMDCGHFVQEEKSDKAIIEIKSFVQKSNF